MSKAQALEILEYQQGCYDKFNIAQQQKNKGDFIKASEGNIEWEDRHYNYDYFEYEGPTIRSEDIRRSFGFETKKQKI